MNMMRDFFIDFSSSFLHLDLEIGADEGPDHNDPLQGFVLPLQDLGRLARRSSRPLQPLNPSAAAPHRQLP